MRWMCNFLKVKKRNQKEAEQSRIPNFQSGLNGVKKEQGNCAQTSNTSISDLPADILTVILRSACVTPATGQWRLETTGLSMNQVKSVSSVCTRWYSLLLSTFRFASCNLWVDVHLALKQLHRVKTVTHVAIYTSLRTGHKEFVRRLATEFPLLTSFTYSHLHRVEDLNNVSLFLSLNTNIQSFFLRTYGELPSANWRSYQKAWEVIDFSKQVKLKTLLLEYQSVGFSYIPVNTTLRQLVNLQELRIVLKDSTMEAPLPLWLAEFPAFVEFKFDNWVESSSNMLLDSLQKMTGLERLSVTCPPSVAEKMGKIFSSSHLTSLYIFSRDSYEPAPFIDTLQLSPNLDNLHIVAEAMPKMKDPLTLLKTLTLAIMGPVAIQPTFFAFTPNLHTLDITISEEVARPHLEYLTQLTSLSVTLAEKEEYDLYFEDLEELMEEPEVPKWHISAALTHTLQELRLDSCMILCLIDGLQMLERHVAVALRCACDRKWYGSYANYAAGGSPCLNLPALSARQLFKDTRRTPPRLPGSCPVYSA